MMAEEDARMVAAVQADEADIARFIEAAEAGFCRGGR